MAIQRSSTSRSLVKVVVAAALGMLLSKSGSLPPVAVGPAPPARATAKRAVAVRASLPPVAVGPSTIRVYHYTNKAGYEGIVGSGHIKPSDIKQGDASYGSGVYVTQLDPSTPFYTILHNNYYMDGGTSGDGKDKSDRADYVFALDLPKSSVVEIDTNRSRSVLHFGDGEEVPLGKATYHGPAGDIAREVKRELEFQEFLSQDPILANAWQLYDNDVKLVFVYMDSVNYEKKLNLKESGNCSRDVPAVVSKTFPPNQVAVRGFDKVLVMLTSDGDVPGCSGDWEQCILHGDIDSVESDLVCKQKQWSKHWLDLLNYPLDHRVIPPTLNFLTKLRREVAARDCSSSRHKDIVFFFFDRRELRSIEHLKDSYFFIRKDHLSDFYCGLNITSLKQQAEGKDKAYVFMAASEPEERLDWNQCLLYGDIEEVFRTLDSWSQRNSRVTGSDLSNFRYRKCTFWL